MVAAMASTTIELSTSDGPMTTEIVTPATGNGPWPAVIFCFDAGGLRPSMTEMAQRIANFGYVVAIPDLFHRVGSISALLKPGQSNIFAIFGDDDARNKFMTVYYPSALAYDHVKVDAGAVLDHFAKRPDVKGGVGTTGYCMGGNISVRIAELFGDRIRACASFHAGGLVTPEPDSPHTKIGQIKAKLLIAAAANDPTFSDEAQRTFAAAMKAAKVDGVVETYPAAHGYAVADNPSYDREVSDRHFKALDSFYKVLGAR